MIIAPSILNVNNLDLNDGIQQAIQCGIERFHIDIMDGHFVPNLSFGPQLVKDFKNKYPLTKIEVHLMSNNLSTFVPLFIKEGADIIEIHYEADSPSNINYWLNYIRSHNCKAGLVLNPSTSINVLDNYINYIDQVLLMTVKPGFGGQNFIIDSGDKIAEVRRLLDAKSLKHIPIEVDGGIDNKSVSFCMAAGSEIFVSGSYIFCKGTIAKQIDNLRKAVNKDGFK